MSISNFKANKWSAKVETEAIEKSIAGQITSGNYQSEVNGVNQLMINLVGDIDIGDYTSETDMTIQSLSDDQKILALSQQKYFAFGVDDTDKAKSQADFEKSAMEKAGKKIALKADEYVLGVNTYGDADIPSDNKVGSIGSSIALTVSNVEEYLSKLATILRENDVEETVYVTVPPAVMDLIRRAGIGSLTDNSAEFANRTIAKYGGMIIVETNQVAKAGTGSDEYQIIANSGRAIPMGVLVNKVEKVAREKQFGSIIKGLYVFGAKVLFPKEIAVLSCTVA